MSILKGSTKNLRGDYESALYPPDRYQVCAYKKAGFTNQSIADELNRHISTIKRELKRNQWLRGYRPQQASRLAQSRQASKSKAIKLTHHR